MSIKSSATICLVPQITGGPFLFWDDLTSSCRQAAEAGFDAVEILPPDAGAIDKAQLDKALSDYRLELGALGTGAGFILQKLHLSSSDESTRGDAVAFINEFIELAANYGAKVIIGSMKGRIEDGVDKAAALDWLRGGLDELGQRASRQGVQVLLEPLNRYETNYVNRLEEAADVLESLQTDNIKMLADLFHMNIEEESICAALTQHARHVGHLHFVDSNRRPAGFGHIDFTAVARTLSDINYSGYLAAEAMAYPNSTTAAAQTMKCFREFFRP